MQFVLDPVWPWSALLAAASGVGVLVAVLAVTAGVLTYTVPALQPHFDWAGPRWLRASLVTLGMIAVWLSLSASGTIETGSTALERFGQRCIGLGSALLLISPLSLVALTVWTYLGVPSITRRRLVTIIALRLLAFLLAILALLRPSLGLADKSQLPATIYLLADRSASMTIADEADSKSRWEALQRHLRDCAPTLRALRDQLQIEVIPRAFAQDLTDLDLDQPGSADGKRTDLGGALSKLFDRREAGRPSKAVLILSDGADNGSARTSPLAEATRWRTMPCPIETFAYGKTTTNDRQSDVVLTAVTAEPAPVPIKGELTVRASIDAFGFEGRRVLVRVMLDDKEVASKSATLALTTGNEVRIKCSAPVVPGEVRLKVRVEDPDRAGEVLDGELSAANNEMTTYITASKEGISVLLIDKPRAWEPQLICDALARDPRIRLFPVWLRGERVVQGGVDLFHFDRQQYDVIVIGDVSAAQVLAINPGALKILERLVNRGAGLMMLGGYDTFGNGDWRNTVLKDLLPIELSPLGQEERKIKMEPTEAGLRLFSYLLRLSDQVKNPRDAWEQLAPLDGMTKLGTPKAGIANVLAVAGNGGGPLLVAGQYGTGRTLAFAGDTTSRWIRDDKTQEMHGRFWRQVIVWLAKQEDAEGTVWAKPDVRRLPARSDLGFTVGIRGKGGVDLPEGTFTAEVTGPDNQRTALSIGKTAEGYRGTFAHAERPGEYRISVKGEGKELNGEAIRGEAAARFLVYEDDVELTQRAANHDLLKKLSAAGGGRFHRGEELRKYLETMLKEGAISEKPRLVLLPDWRSTTRSPFLMLFFLLFVVLLTAEWALRRKWGLV